MPLPSLVPQQIYTSRFNRVLAVVIWAGSALSVAGILTLPFGSQWLYIVPCALIALLGLVALWKPRLVISDEQLEVGNVFSTVTIPWPALVHLDTRFSLTLYTPRRKFSVWVAPAPGRATTLRATRATRAANIASGADTRPGDLIGTESGDAAALVNARWEALREQNRIETGVADDTVVTRRAHWITLVALVMLSAASVVAIAAA